MWYGRPQLLFSVTVCPTGQMHNEQTHKVPELVLFNTFEPKDLTPNSIMQWHHEVPMLYEKTQGNSPQTCTLETWTTSWEGLH